MIDQPAIICTCPSGDGSLRYPCPVHANECTAQPAAAQEAVTPLGYVRLEAIKRLRDDDEVTGVMVHVDAPTDSVPVFLAPVAAAPAECREQAIKVARESALAHSTQHSYLPQSRGEARVWQPHEWVVTAIQAAALPSAPAAPGIDLTTAEVGVIEALLALAYAAWNAADNGEDNGESLTIERSEFAAVGKALDTLDALPDDRPGYVMEAAAKARWALRRLLSAPLIDASPKGGSDGQVVPYQRALDLIGDAYNAGTHGIGYSQQAMELHDSMQATSAEVGA